MQTTIVPNTNAFHTVFTSFKIKKYFSYKDPILDDLKSFLVYKFTCASYIGDIFGHFKSRIEENIKKDKK